MNRYYKKEYEQEYYIFDSETITEKEFQEKQEYQGYKAFEDSLTGDEIINQLNYYSFQMIEAGKLIEEGIQLARENRRLKNRNHNAIGLINDCLHDLNNSYYSFDREGLKETFNKLKYYLEGE